MHPMNRPAAAKGFTLIELMVAVAIVGILTAIAVPSYKDYIVKGKRSAVQAFMLDAASKEKQYLLDARAYSTNLTTVGAPVPSDISATYTVTVTVTSAPPAFTVTAVPVAGSSQASDGTLTLTSDGAKSPTAKW